MGVNGVNVFFDNIECVKVIDIGKMQYEMFCSKFYFKVLELNGNKDGMLCLNFKFMFILNQLVVMNLKEWLKQQ